MMKNPDDGLLGKKKVTTESGGTVSEPNTQQRTRRWERVGGTIITQLMFGGGGARSLHTNNKATRRSGTPPRPPDLRVFLSAV